MLRESTDWGLSRCEGEPGFTGAHTVGQERPLVSLGALTVPGERSTGTRLTLGSVVSSSPSGSSADFSHFCPQVVERRRTPAEIREEFERLQCEREESRLQQHTNPKGTINVSTDATDLFDRYEEEYEDVSGSGFPQIEINKMHISQSIVAPQQLQTQPSSLEASQPRMGMEGVPLTLRSDESLLRRAGER